MNTPPTEKRGNTAWCQCAGCKGWFPVGLTLIDRASVKLHCPHCHGEFTPSESAEIVRPA